MSQDYRVICTTNSCGTWHLAMYERGCLFLMFKLNEDPVFVDKGQKIDHPLKMLLALRAIHPKV